MGVTTYAGPAGDHNDHAMAQVGFLGEALAQRLGTTNHVVGTPVPAEPRSWSVELERCRGGLLQMAERVDEVMCGGAVPISAITRCAVALATQPVVLGHRPDAVVVWLDAHGDINVPSGSATGYLGGMALSGPMGWWDSGLGAGLPAAQVVLVGARDLDPGERERVEAGAIRLVPGGDGLGDRLASAIAGRPASVHLDCDVLEPGLIRTDYSVPEGLSLDDLRSCAEAAAHSEVLGVEVGEFEGEGGATIGDLLDALEPLLT